MEYAQKVFSSAVNFDMIFIKIKAGTENVPALFKGVTI